jgi:hypothetical protein
MHASENIEYVQLVCCSWQDEPETVQQSDEQRASLAKLYGPERLFTVIQDITGSQLYDLTLKKGSQVGVVKEGDPMGNRDRWFVDCGCKY